MRRKLCYCQCGPRLFIIPLLVYQGTTKPHTLKYLSNHHKEDVLPTAHARSWALGRDNQSSSHPKGRGCFAQFKVPFTACAAPSEIVMHGDRAGNMITEPIAPDLYCQHVCFCVNCGPRGNHVSDSELAANDKLAGWSRYMLRFSRAHAHNHNKCSPTRKKTTTTLHLCRSPQAQIQEHDWL